MSPHTKEVLGANLNRYLLHTLSTFMTVFYRYLSFLFIISIAASIDHKD